ncbi:MAG TPA: hypothetical protein VM325_11825 [Alphaproteobacteria bacterium]|nr:hypothetical protein [Alphaproteobacteria bacterium]
MNTATIRSLGLVALVATAAVIGTAPLTATPAEAAIQVKSLKVDHRTRGRPIVTVRLIDGRWQVKSSDVVRFDLKVEVKSKKNRMRSAWLIFGGRSYHLWRGGKTWTLRWKKFTAGFAGAQLGDHANGAARACGNLMKGRSGSARFNHKIKVTFQVSDKKDRKAAASKFVSAFLDCKR